LKNIFIVTLVLLCLGLVSNCNREDTTQLAKDEFEKYDNGKNEVVLNIEDNLYFEDYILMRDDMPSHITGTYIFHQNSIYYLRIVSTGILNKHKEAFQVYSCDLYGKNSKLVYSKNMDVYGTVKVQAQGDSYYFQYTKNDLVFIDRYTISTNTYETVYSGTDCRISDYIQEEESQYSIEITENSFYPTKERGKFVITDSETGTKRIIDDDYLKNTIYYQSMNMFGYGPDRFDISKGHILLTYGIGAGDGWNYPYLIFEYDFETDTLEYKMLAFPFDSVPIEILYIK